MKSSKPQVSEEPTPVLRRHAEPVTLAEALAKIAELYGDDFAEFCRFELVTDLATSAMVCVKDLLETLRLAFAHFNREWLGGAVDEEGVLV